MEIYNTYIGNMVRADAPIEKPVTKLGGKPVFIEAIVEPTCRQCGMKMDFLAQIELDQPIGFSQKYKMAYIFMCSCLSNEKGWLTCETWQPYSGANSVILQENNNYRLIPEKDARYPDYEVTFIPSKEKLIVDNEDDLPSESTKIGGVPAWLQSDDTPHCPDCGKRMKFVAQLNAELDGSLPADPTQWESYQFFDFGDVGLGYLFICEDDCKRGGAFIWQST